MTRGYTEYTRSCLGSGQGKEDYSLKCWPPDPTEEPCVIRKLKFIQDTRAALPTSSWPLFPSAPMQMVIVTGELEVGASQPRGRLAYSPGQAVTGISTRMMTAMDTSNVEQLGSQVFACRPAESEVCGRYCLD